MGDFNPLVAASSSNAEMLRSNCASEVWTTSERTSVIRGMLKKRNRSKIVRVTVAENLFSVGGFAVCVTSVS